jgi:3-dehydroquinate dehydratase
MLFPISFFANKAGNLSGHLRGPSQQAAFVVLNPPARSVLQISLIDLLSPILLPMISVSIRELMVP